MTRTATSILATAFLFTFVDRPARAAGSPPPEAAAEAEAPPAAAAPSRPDSATILPSLNGPVGLYRVSTAEVGPPLHLRFGLHAQYFSTSNFLVKGDEDSGLAGALTFGFTPARYLEIFGGFYTASNRNTRQSEAGRSDPDVIRTHGDLVIGPKLAAPVGRAGSLGFEVGARLMAAASGLSFSPSSTSVWFGPLATLDFRSLGGVPLRLHANVSYYVDNSANVYDLDGTTPQSREAAKFAYGISASRLRLAAGLDAPLEPFTGAVPLRPFAEYHFEVITADVDPVLAQMPSANGSRERQWVTVGLRARIPGGVTLDAGADFRVHNNAVAYAPPLPSYDVVFGASYPLDVDAFRRPVVVTHVVEKPAPAPPPTKEALEGRITGVAKDKAGKGIGHAVVAVTGVAHGSVVTDADGSFETPLVPPGPTTVEVSAADFEPEKLTVAVTAGSTAKVDVALTAKTRTGNVRGKTTDAQGHAVEATLRFSGAQSLETRTDSGGLYSAALVPGPYKVVAEAPGLPARESQLDVVAGEARQIDMKLRPVSADLTVKDDEVTLRIPIVFKGAGAPRVAATDQQAELDGVAALLEDRPDIRVLRIEAHWDATAGAKAKPMTDAQAAAVKDYLVKKGIPAERLEAVGAGSDRPLMPNITPAYRARNRRVELHIVR